MRKVGPPRGSDGSGDAGLLTGRAEPRLIQLLDFDRPTGGSFTPLIAGLLGEAKRRGWRVDAVMFDSARGAGWLRELEAAGAGLTFVPRGGDEDLGRWLSDQLSLHEGPTVLHSHFHGFDLASLRARRRRAGVAIVWHVHSTFSREPWRVLPAVVKFGILGRGVDAIFCPAQNIVDSTVRRFARRDRVHFVPSAIRVDRFAPADENERRAARAELGIDDGLVALLHFGWHRHLKGGDVFVDTIKVLAEGGVDVIGLERGGGPEYRAQADDLGLGDRLRMVEPVEDIRALHAAADILVSPSRTEGMAYALLESLEVGTPVVATPIPGHAFLAENMPACQTTELDPGAIAATIEEVLARSPEQTAEERVQAQRWIADNLSVDVVSAEIVDRYEALLAARP